MKEMVTRRFDMAFLIQVQRWIWCRKEYWKSWAIRTTTTPKTTTATPKTTTTTPETATTTSKTTTITTIPKTAPSTTSAAPPTTTTTPVAPTIKRESPYSEEVHFSQLGL